MNLARNAALSLEILAAHRLRTLLSMLGLVVGVGAVVLMVAVGRGSEKRILDRIRAMGTNLIVVSAGQQSLVAGRKRQVSTVTTLAPGDAEAIVEQCPSVALAAACASRTLTVQWEAEAASAQVAGMSPDGFRIRNISAAAGRLFDPEEDRGRRRVAILGRTVVERLFGNADPVGCPIRIGRVPFDVIGVAAAKGMDPNGSDQDNLVVIPLETAMRRLLNVTYVQAIYIQGRSGAELGRAEDEIRDLLRKRHRLGAKSDDFTIENQASLLETERETARSLTLLVGSVAGISLLVGGFGILAVMLISVRERRREIGLRRALGARRRDIRNQFLLEAGLLAGSGGAMGVLGGIGAAWVLSSTGDWEAIISWPAAFLAFSFSVSLGVVFGLHPAIRAARLEPIAALRAE